jgi:septal ring factor EnvC (AmiA/AmiB activator)
MKLRRILARLRHALAKAIAPDAMFNSDMSLELDARLEQIEKLSAALSDAKAEIARLITELHGSQMLLSSFKAEIARLRRAQGGRP